MTRHEVMEHVIGKGVGGGDENNVAHRLPVLQRIHRERLQLHKGRREHVGRAVSRASMRKAVAARQPIPVWHIRLPTTPNLQHA